MAGLVAVFDDTYPLNWFEFLGFPLKDSVQFEG
jgi:hypothetical protein